MTLYAIGDIHGHLDQLRAAHARIAADRVRTGADSAALVHVGDLVDRGPDSAGVVDHLERLARADRRIITLRGNHDQYLIDLLTAPRGPALQGIAARWIGPDIGGLDTLDSYAIPAAPLQTLPDRLRTGIPPAHQAFLTTLPDRHRAGDCLFVHAGIRPGIALSAQDPRDLIWIRDDFLLDRRDHGALVVHGHTPAQRAEHHGNRLAIDSGVAWGGALSAVAIEGRRAFLLTDAGRLPLEPLG